MGEIVLLNQGLYKFELPPMPPERDIWYVDLPKKLQYWKTPHVDKFKWLNQDRDQTLKDVMRMSLRDRVEYIEYWDDKIQNGLWIMVNGEPTWLAPMHVEHLVFNKFKGRFLWYMDGQRKRFYFRLLSEADELCDGRVWIKPRRAGLTTEQITYNISKVQEDFYNRVALQSTKDEVCLRTLMKPTIDTFISRPSWARAQFYLSNGKKPQKSLQLTSNVVKSDMEVMNGLIQAFPTEASAVDGDEWIGSTIDEFSKITACNPREMLDINLKAMANPGKENGMIDALSTSGDKAAAAIALFEWHRLIAESDPRFKGEDGKTKSGLWKYFVEITESHFVIIEVNKYLKYAGYNITDVRDVYGKVNKEICEEWVWKQHNKFPKNSQKYIYSLYKLPIEEAHALITPAHSKQILPKLRMTTRRNYLEALPTNQKPYVRGRFEEDSQGRVWFEEDEEGVWLISVHPYFSSEKDIDTRNRFRNRNGFFLPPVNPEFVAGYDQTRYKTKNTTSDNLSEACCIWWKKFDYFNSGVKNEYAALMLYRPDDPKEAHRQVALSCRYFAGPVMAERQVETTEDVFIDMNMEAFLLKGKDKIWGIYTSAKTIENGFQKLAAKFALPKTEEDEDQVEKYPFEDGLRDLESADPNNMQNYHVTSASILCEAGAEQLVQTNTTDDSVRRMLKAAQSVFPPVR
jgi:hypothetical protein